MAVKESLLHSGKGYDQILDIVPSHLIDSINSKKDMLYPVRASTHKKQYAEGNACKDLFGIAVWWSQITNDWHEVQQIDSIIYPEIKKHMPNATFYASDIVTINGPSRWLSPHVDTPHRFAEYNNLASELNFDLLGIQVIIPLDDLDKDTGATGLWPESHRKDWNIQDCYDGIYDNQFKDNAIQLDMPKGSILLYNTRLVHSTMPLKLSKKRSILLINYLSSDIIDNVKKLDNVWSSNGK
jgi:ectoine hydroxylase-related dioxygenase (phytanoyl-CoA dioxygenase family)